MKIKFLLGVFSLVFIRKEIRGCFEVVEALGFSQEYYHT